MTRMIENRTFDEIAIGDKASMVRMLHEGDAETWAAVTGNVNLIDLDPGPADTSMFAHGGGQVMWAASLFSTLAGTELPGLGSLTTNAEMHFHRPVGVEIPVTVSITVVEKREDTNSVVFDCKAVDPTDAPLLTGTIEVLAPRAKLSLARAAQGAVAPRGALPAAAGDVRGPAVALHRVVHPCSDDALVGAIEAAKVNLITPIVTNLDRPPERVVAFYNGRGTAEQWIKEGKNALVWTRLSCRGFE